MKVLTSVSPYEIKSMNTEELRERVVVKDIMQADKCTWNYCTDDRIMVGGCMPMKKDCKLENCKETGQSFFLENRELGIVNIGKDTGKIVVDGVSYTLRGMDGMYIGRGTKDVVFVAESGKNPKFYLASTPAHASYPTTYIDGDTVEAQTMGSQDLANIRTAHKYIHSNGVQSCQLVLGVNTVQQGNVWNTVPPHTHYRRMETFFYFNLPEDQFYLQVIGEKNESRHVILRNEEGIVSAPWQMHFGVGTCRYDFCFAMAGENRSFADMDPVAMKDIR
jgi:4-deoxy-L-threo-5-hexosulose-uronate ketol-isomerase